MISTDEYEIRFIFTKLMHHFANSAASVDRWINWKTQSSSPTRCKNAPLMKDCDWVLCLMAVSQLFCQNMETESWLRVCTEKNNMFVYIRARFGVWIRVCSVPHRVGKLRGRIFIWPAGRRPCSPISVFRDCLMKTSGPGRQIVINCCAVVTEKLFKHTHIDKYRFTDNVYTQCRHVKKKRKKIH